MSSIEELGQTFKSLEEKFGTQTFRQSLEGNTAVKGIIKSEFQRLFTDKIQPRFREYENIVKALRGNLIPQTLLRQLRCNQIHGYSFTQIPEILANNSKISAPKYICILTNGGEKVEILFYCSVAKRGSIYCTPEQYAILKHSTVPREQLNRVYVRPGKKHIPWSLILQKDLVELGFDHVLQNCGTFFPFSVKQTITNTHVLSLSPKTVIWIFAYATKKKKEYVLLLHVGGYIRFDNLVVWKTNVCPKFLTNVKLNKLVRYIPLPIESYQIQVLQSLIQK